MKIHSALKCEKQKYITYHLPSRKAADNDYDLVRKGNSDENTCDSGGSSSRNDSSSSAVIVFVVLNAITFFLLNMK